MNNLHALVVDDSKSARLFLKNLLADQQIRVNLAGSGDQALTWLKEHRPDVVFLDHVMADMDGLEVLERLKGDPETQDIPVVMCTSNDEEDFIRQVEALGAVARLSKPPTPSLLFTVLTKLRALKAEAERLEEERFLAEAEQRAQERRAEEAAEADRREQERLAAEAVEADKRERERVAAAVPQLSLIEVMEAVEPRLIQWGDELESRVSGGMEDRLAKTEEALQARWADALEQHRSALEGRIAEALDQLKGPPAGDLESQVAAAVDGQMGQWRAESEQAWSRLLEEKLGDQQPSVDDREAAARLDKQLGALREEVEKLKLEKQNALQSFRGSIGKMVHEEMESNFFATEAYIKSKAEEIINPPLDEWRKRLFNDPKLKEDMREAVQAAAREEAELQWDRTQESLKKLDVAAIVESRVADSATAVQTVLRDEIAAAVRDSAGQMRSRMLTIGVGAAMAGAMVGVAAGFLL